MNVAIVETCAKPTRAKTIDAHLRNSYTLQEELRWDLIVDRPDYEKFWLKKYDAIIVSYGSFYAPVHLMEPFIKKNASAKLFWMTNEYNLGMNSFLNKQGRHIEIITNFENVKNMAHVHTVNLNALMWHERNPLGAKKYQCVYYGTFRKDRERYFREYLHKPIYLSCNDKNTHKFLFIGCNPKMVKKLKWPYLNETLNLFNYSLYIEDVYTHRVYNYMANRFYEALFCNTCILFDINCKNTIEKSAFDVPDDFMVSCHTELVDKINTLDYDEVYAYQLGWNKIAKKEKRETLKKLKKIVES